MKIMKIKSTTFIHIKNKTIVKQNLLILALFLFTIGMMYSMLTRNINLMIACESCTLISIALLVYLLKKKI